MDTQEDFGQKPVMELGLTKNIDTSRQHKKKLSGIRKIEGMQPRTEGIPGIEDRRLLALQRHIKRKRRRRPYVKKTSKLDDTCQGHQDQTCSENPEKKRPADSGVFDIADDKCSSYDTDVGLKKEFEENFGGRSKNRQDAHFDRLVGHLLARIEVELLQKVEAGLNDQSVEKEDQTKEEGRAYWEDKRSENFTQADAKDLNSATMHQVAGLDSRDDVGKINQQAIVDDDYDDDDDEDDGFMPRKLFFFCFSHFKTEET